MKKTKIIINSSTFQENDSDDVTDVINNLTDNLLKVNDSLEITILKPMSKMGQRIIKKENYKIHCYSYFWPKKYQLFHTTGIVPGLKLSKFNYLKLLFLFVSQFLNLLILSIKLKPEYIYAHWVLPQALISAFVCKILKIKLVFTTHGAEVLLINKLKFGNKLILNFITKNAYKFTANSELTLSEITRNCKTKYIQDKYKIIPMGIKNEIFCSDKLKKTYTDNDFLYVGRLIDYKGVDILLDALSMLKNSNRENFKLEILGNGIDEEGLKEMVKNNDLIQNVNFNGFKNLDEKIKFYEHASVTFVTSKISNQRLEGGPLTLIEAMAQKNICIVSDSIGFKKYLNNNNCILFESGNSKSLLKAIDFYTKMTKDEREDMGNEAYITSEFFKFQNIAGIHNDFLFSDFINN